MSNAQGHLVVDDLVSLKAATELAHLAESEDRWKLHEEWFFSQNDFSWVRREFGRQPVGDKTPAIEELISSGKALFETRFNSVIGRHFTVVGHKMNPGQVVGIHNDSPDQDRGRIENFRLVYYVDRDYQDDKGGHLVVFGSRDAADVLDVVRPIFNSAVLMHLSDRSFHAVGRVKRGVRYSIVASYWGYPILFQARDDQSRVRNLLNRIIDEGLEEVPHSGTTFAYHLYNTFRILHGWRQDIDICLAGLAHSLIGRSTSGVRGCGISPEDLRRIVGDKAFSVIQVLRGHDGLLAPHGEDAWVSRATYVVELANLLEQAFDEQDFAQVLERARSCVVIAPEIVDLVEADVGRIRAAREVAVSP
jgi:hypothetical protein